MLNSSLHFPPLAVVEAEVLVADTVTDNKTRIEVICRQEELIKEEAKKEEEEVR